MNLRWIRESPARWDVDKARIVGEAPQGTFSGDFRHLRDAAVVPGDWWRVEDEGRVVGYGWMDVVWGDAEILLAVDPAVRGHGVGTFVLERLQFEAARCGLHCLCNVVPPNHPRREQVTQWLEARGYSATADGRLLRTVVRGAAA